MRRIACALLTLAACSVTPPVPVVRPWNDAGSAPISIDEDERALWEESKREREELQNTNQLVDDPALAAYLNGVLTALVSQPLPPEAPQPTVRVMRSPVRTGLTFPDGEIMVTTGVLAALQNEAQLAAMLGHELGHFLGRHQLVQKRFAKVSRSTAERMELSRNLEAACDRYALEALRRANYDPRQEIAMLELIGLEEEDARRRPSLFQTHPFTRERIRELRRAIGETPDDMRLGTDAYNRAIAGVLPVAAEVELKAGLLDNANASIARLMALEPENGHAYYLKGEHARLTEREGRRSAAARSAYERAVTLAPEDPDAVRALAFLYHGEGNVAGATPLLEKYLQLVPDASDRKLIERYLGRSGP